MIRAVLLTALVLALCTPVEAGVTVSAGNNYAGNTTIITTVPWTVSFFAYPTTLDATYRTLFALVDKDGTDRWMVLSHSTQARIVLVSSSNYYPAWTSAAPSSRWNHYCAVLASSTSRSAYINGGNKGTNNSAASPSGIDRVVIGNDPVGIYSPFIGIVAHLALWNVALTDDEVYALSRGTDPRRVRPWALVAYWLLDVHDAAGPLDLTINAIQLNIVAGTPASAESPPIHRPGPQYSRHPALAPGYYRPAPRLRDDQENYHALAA